MKSKKTRYFITAFLMLSLLTVCAYAAAMNQISYVERFETGKVDIRIQELSVIAEGETTESQDVVEANKDVSYIPRVINCSADCYVRAKVEVVMDGDCTRPLETEDIYGISEDWIKKGDYFYYSKILRENQVTDIFKGIHIPADWEHDGAEGFAINVRAEAVQSANFYPDFHSELPWGAVELNAVATASGGECIEATPVSRVSNVEFTADGGFQCRSSELFDGFSSMMPGDRIEKTVRIKNSAKGTLKTSLKINAGSSELNRKMNLKISADDREIYNGTAKDADALEVIDLMEITKGRTGTVKFEAELPAGSDNSFAELQDDIVWELNAEIIPDESVQTGDLFELWPLAAAALAALITLYVLMHKRKEENEAGHQDN